jgi:uncharacterized protein YukE
VPGEISGAGFHVVPDALTKHAGSVEKVADAIDQAGAAGEHVRLGYGAYGVLMIQVPMLLDPVQEQVVQAARDSAFALRSAADLLKDLAIRYQSSDQSSDQLLSDSGAGLIP